MGLDLVISGWSRERQIVFKISWFAFLCVWLLTASRMLFPKHWDGGLGSPACQPA